MRRGSIPCRSTSIRLAAPCLRADMPVPAVVMLGAAAEGAWVEFGRALVVMRPEDGKSVAESLDTDRMGLAKVTTKVAQFFARNDLFKPLLGAEYNRDRARVDQAVSWTDRVRDARNVLHWGVEAAVPNTYDTVATLPLGAGATIQDLYSIANRMRAGSSSPGGTPAP